MLTYFLWLRGAGLAPADSMHITIVSPQAAQLHSQAAKYFSETSSFKSKWGTWIEDTLLRKEGLKQATG